MGVPGPAHQGRHTSSLGEPPILRHPGALGGAAGTKGWLKSLLLQLLGLSWAQEVSKLTAFGYDLGDFSGHGAIVKSELSLLSGSSSLRVGWDQTIEAFRCISSGSALGKLVELFKPFWCALGCLRRLFWSLLALFGFLRGLRVAISGAHGFSVWLLGVRCHTLGLWKPSRGRFLLICGALYFGHGLSLVLMVREALCRGFRSILGACGC